MGSPIFRQRFFIGVSFGLAATAALLCTTLAHSAVTPEAKCKSAKLSATGKLSSALLGCESKAVKKGEPTDAACLTKAYDKHTASFAKAEGDGACNGVDTITADLAAALAAEVTSDLAGSEPSENACTAAKLKASGKYASALYKAEAANVRTSDSAKLTQARAKAAAKLAGAFTKADDKGVCLTAADAAVVGATVGDGVADVEACVAAAHTCSETQADVVGGGTITTDPSSAGATAGDPVTTLVTSPTGGTVVIRETDPTVDPPTGYEVLGQQIDVTAPAATAAAPLELRFELHSSFVPPDPNTVRITRDGVIIGECNGAPGEAQPDPCLDARTLLPSLNLAIDVLTSQASDWQFVLPLAGLEPRCPDTMAIASLGQARESCATNADCEVGACNPSLGRCVTPTDVDRGWTGLGHDGDVTDESTTVVSLSCAAQGPVCGQCDVVGIDPALGNCRCASNNRITCDEPFVADADDCGGGTCNCYDGPPLPLSTGNTPICVLNRYVDDVTGTVDLDTGASTMSSNIRSVVYLGEGLVEPCPYCEGDTVAGDGLRAGTCVFGPNSAMACDADAVNLSFPAPGGGGHSLDCFPAPGKNVSGTGLIADVDETTGTSTLGSNVLCGFPPSIALSCHCGQCSHAATVPCSSDVECNTLSPGATCQRRGAFEPMPNQCDIACVDIGGGEAQCDIGPVDLGCDGIVRADGNFVISCATNADCEEANIGVDAGACTMARLRECFSPTIVAQGGADPQFPVTAALYCSAVTANSGVNAVYGWPGPIRAETQKRINAFCDADPYAPSVGCQLVEPPPPPPTCSFSAKFGTLGSGPGQMDKPTAVAVDAGGNIYVADQSNQRVQKFDSSGNFVTQWGGFGSADGQFSVPVGIAVDQNGFVYVSDLGNFRIQKFTDTGTFVTKWGSGGSADGQLNNHFGISVDNQGFVYVADRVNQRIQKFTDGGVFVAKWGTAGTADGQFDDPYGVAADGNGHVYVADTMNHRIQKFTDTGVFVAKWGGLGTANGQFDAPHGVAADGSGFVYVADRENHRVQTFTDSGAFVLGFGQQGGGDGAFQFLTHVDVDGAGNVYVADQYNDRVQVFACP